MNITTEILHRIIADVFDEMLGMSTEFFDPESGVVDENHVAASIRISGDVEGVVVIEAPAKTAEKIGSIMFEAPADSLEEQEVCDAVGEIVNMIGGNIKGVSGGDSQLSLPCVSNRTARVIPDIPISEQADLLVSGCPLKVTWHHVPAMTAAAQG